MEDSPRGNLREKIAARISEREDSEEIEKDLHLVEAALDTDRVVISTDNRARTAFDELADQGVGELSQLGWLNPDEDEIEVLSEDELLDALPKLGALELE